MSARTSSLAPRRIVAAASVAALAGGLLVIGGGAASAAPGAVADHEKRGSCGPNAFYDADLERDDGRLEMSFEIDGARAGEKWNVAMKQNGDRVLKQVFTTDREREIDVERNLTDNRGVDTVKVTAKKVGGGGKCTVTLVR